MFRNRNIVKQAKKTTNFPWWSTWNRYRYFGRTTKCSKSCIKGSQSMQSHYKWRRSCWYYNC